VNVNALGNVAHVRRPRLRPTRFLQYALLVVITAINVLPLVWVGISSVKANSEILQYPPTFLPAHLTAENFVGLFTGSPFGKYMENSAVVALVTTAAVEVLGVFSAYAFVRFKFWFIRGIGELSLFAYMIPSILLLAPLLRIMFWLQLDNTLYSLMIIYTALFLPFALWILRSNFQGVSIELEEAAMVDGCTRFGAFLRVVLPQVVPGLIATAIFTFNASWSEFLFASVLISNPDRLTISPGLNLLIPVTAIVPFGLITAASVAMTIPIMILFIVANRQLVETWNAGAVKG